MGPAPEETIRYHLDFAAGSMFEVTCFALLFSSWDLNIEDIVIIAMDMSSATPPGLIGAPRSLVANDDVARIDKFIGSVVYY